MSTDLIWQKAHSTYLSLWSELGIVFGSLPLLAIAIIAFGLLSALRDGRGSWTAQTIALGAITVGATHSLLDFSLEIQAVTLTFVTMVAAGTATALPRTLN